MRTLLRVQQKLERAQVLASLHVARSLGALRKYAVRSLRDLAVPDLRRGVPQRLVDDLVEAMTFADLVGRQVSLLLLQEAGLRVSASLFDDAMEELATQFEVDLDELQETYRSRALKVVNDTSRHVERELRAAIAEANRQGLTGRDAVKQVTERFDALGLSPRNSYSVENLVRTQTSLTFNAARWRADQDPTVRDVIWGYTYNTVGDDRVRDAHADLDGVTLPKDDPFWRRFWPPNGWSCRCQVIPLFAPPDQQVRPPRDAEPDEDFDFNPGEVFHPQESVPALAGPNATLQDILPRIEKLKREIEETDDEHKRKVWSQKLKNLTKRAEGLKGGSPPPKVVVPDPPKPVPTISTRPPALADLDEKLRRFEQLSDERRLTGDEAREYKRLFDERRKLRTQLRSEAPGIEHPFVSRPTTADVGPYVPKDVPEFKDVQEAREFLEKNAKVRLTVVGTSKQKAAKAAVDVAEAAEHMKASGPRLRAFVENTVHYVKVEPDLTSNRGIKANGLYYHNNGDIGLEARLTSGRSVRPTYGEWTVGAKQQDVYRHEYGHAFWFAKKGGANALTSQERIEFTESTKKYVRREGDQFAHIRKHPVSQYAGTNPAELFAESFSAYTHPEYQRGGLPSEIESFLDKVTGR